MDGRPSAAVAHVTLTVRDVDRCAAFWLDLGLRAVWRGPAMAIVELRGGTHLLLFAAGDEPPSATIGFDLMVDDVAAVRAAALARGVRATEPVHDARSGHTSFELTDPEGRQVSICSSHTDCRPV